MPLVQNSKVTILFLNIRGFLSHRAELEAYISAHPSFSFVGITESFLEASVKFVGMVWIKTKQNKDSEVALTMKITENKIVLSYGVGWEAYFHHKEYQGFIEIIAAAEEKFEAYKTSISKKGAGKSYGKRENY